MYCGNSSGKFGRAFAWYRLASPKGGSALRAPFPDGAKTGELWPEAGRALLWRFAPAVEPRPRADWLADFSGCSLIYPDLLAVSRAALRELLRAHSGAALAAVCVAQSVTVARLVAFWRWRECIDGFLVPAGEEADAVAPLPLRALYLPPPAIESLSRIGLRQLGDVARLERGAIDLMLGRRLAHIAFRQSRGLDVSPPRVSEKPQAAVERVPVAHPGVSSLRELAPYLEILCWRISYLLFAESAPRAIRRLDLTLHYIDGGKRAAGLTLSEPAPHACDFIAASAELAARAHSRRVNVIAAELAASRFYPHVAQEKLFVPESRVKAVRIEESVNRVRTKYGFDAIKTASQLAGAGV